MDSKLEILFHTIENSKEYQAYLKMTDILNKDKEIKKIIEEIKELEKKATYLENIGDEEYKKIDEAIKEKTLELEQRPVYQEYLNKMNEFNDELAVSSKMIDDYIEEKV